jgi:recombination protein RecA
MPATRARIEALLKERRLDTTLLPADAQNPGRRVESTGLADLDVRMAGGWPVGEISEIVGPASSGRTAVLWSSLAAATTRGQFVAVVDGLDSFDPRPAAEMGMDLARVLWIRGTPAAATRLRSSSFVEVSPKRFARRRMSHAGTRRANEDPYARLVDRAIKAFGLVLDAGGFGIVALDLADVPAKWLAGLPFTTWRRLQRMVEGRETIALVMAPEPVARSARGITVRLSADAAATPVWQGTSARARRLTGLTLVPQIVSARRLSAGLAPVPAFGTTATFPERSR